MVTGSDMSDIKVNLTVPTGWSELNDDQLRYVYSLIANQFSADEIKTLALMKWSKCKVLARNGKGTFLMQHEKLIFEVTNSQFAELLSFLNWLDTIPSSPVCLMKIGKHHSVDPNFYGVQFESYLVVENLYQGFLTTKQDTMLDEISHVLYPGLNGTLTTEERVSILYWVASLKDLLARNFVDFFQPVTSDVGNLLDNSIGKQLQDSMNAMIRALTKGDITKEKEILSMDTWRALTELNAQAREYKEINTKYGNKK